MQLEKLVDKNNAQVGLFGDISVVRVYSLIFFNPLFMCCFFFTRENFQTLSSHGQGVPRIIERTSKMESSDDLRSELYTIFLSGMV